MAGSAVVGILRALLTLDSAQFEDGVRKSSNSANAFAKDLKKFGQQAADVGKSLTAALTVPIVGIGGGAIKAFTDFESSFAGVRKTVTASEAEFAALAQGFRDLSKEIPIDVNELNKLGESAGQLGIHTENILGFTEVMAELGVTTNLSAEEAASALARLANITQMPQDQFSRLGSTIVALGNNFATTESEIVDFGLRIAGAGHLAGLTEPQILAIGTAMSSVGIESEAGGTAVQKVLLSMVQAAAQGGGQLTTFAKTAGMTSDQFKQAFEKDAAGAFVAFVTGLGKQGTSAIGTLDDLGLSDQRLVRSFLTLAGSGDLLTRAITVGNDAWRDNTALGKEAEQRFKTMESQLKLLWNQVKDVSISLGMALAPAFQSVIDLARSAGPYIESIVKWFAELPTPVKDGVIAFAALAAAVGPVIYVFGQIAMSAGAIIKFLPLLAEGFFAAASGVKGFSLALVGLELNPVVLALTAAAAGLVVLSGELDKGTEAMRRNIQALQDKQLIDKLSHKDTELTIAESQQLKDAMDRQSKAIKGVTQQNVDLSSGLKITIGQTQSFGKAAAGAAPHVDTVSEALKKAQTEVNRLSASQLADIDSMKKLGRTDDEIRDKLGLSKDAYHLLETRVAATTKATSEYDKALQEIKASNTAVTAAQHDSILADTARGVSVAAIAEHLKLQEVQVRNVIAAQKAQQTAEKQQTDDAKANAAIYLGLAEKKAQSLIDLVALDQSTGERLKQQGASGVEAKLLQINAAEAAELRSLATKYDKNTQYYKDAEQNIRTYYAHERDIANETASTIEERLRSEGIMTAAELSKRATNFKATYDFMLASGKYTQLELTAAKEKWLDADAAANGRSLVSWQSLLDTLAAGFAQMAQIGGAGFSKITQGIGLLFSGMSTLGKSLTGIKTSFTALGKEGGLSFKNLAAAGTSIIGAIGAVAGAVSSLWHVFTDKKGRDAIVAFANDRGGFDALHTKLLAAGAAGEAMWVKLTQGTPGNDPAAAAKNIQEAKDLIDATAKSAEDMAKAFTDAQGQIGAALAGVTGKIGGQASTMLDLRQKVVDAQQAYDALLTSGDASQEDLAKAAKVLAEAQGNVSHAVVTSQDEFDRLSRIALNTFTTLVASGVDPVTAMQRVGSSVDDLINNVKAFGLSGNAAFDQLSRWRDLTTTNAPLLAQVGSLNDLMTLTTTLGGMNAAAFADMQAQGVSAYQQLLAAGFTQSEAFATVKPLIENEIKLHEQKGYAIDDATQAIIDQARANGDLSDQELSTNDILQQGLGQIIQLLGGDLPDAWRRTATAAQSATSQWVALADSAVNDISTTFDGIHFDIPINFTPGDLPDMGGFGSGAPLPGFASGTHGQFVDFGPATTVQLHGKERVVTEREQQTTNREMAAMFNSLSRSMSGGGGDIVLHIDNMIDPDKLDRRTVRVTRAAAARGEIPIPQSSVRVRVPNG